MYSQLLTNLAVQATVDINARAHEKGAIMITTSSEHHSQTTKPPYQQRVPPHFCFQRQLASPTKISYNSQIPHPPSQQEPSPKTLHAHTATGPQPMTDNLTKGCPSPDSAYQPQSGYPVNDQPPTHHDADSNQEDSADYEEGLLGHSEVLQPQSRSPFTAPAETPSHLPASHSSRSDDQLCDDHIALDSSEAVAEQQVPEAAAAHFLQLRPPQCSRLTPQLVPGAEWLAVNGSSNHSGSCQHRDQTAEADQMDVDAMPGGDPIPKPHKRGKVGPVEPVESHDTNIPA